MKVALVSLDPAWEDRSANLRLCADAAERAAAAGAELVVFPEMTLTGFSMNAAAVAEPAAASPTVSAFISLAARLRAHVAFGVVLHGESRPRNCLVVVGPDGELARYAKVHPFSYAGEHEHFEGGSERVVAAVGGVRFGLSVCYDLRFPELYMSLAPSCDAVLVIANWPAARIAHWHLLLQARSVDAQCLVLGVNRTGVDGNGIEYPRSTAVFSPRGERLAPVHCDGCIDIWEIDAAMTARDRSTFPTLRDRRPDVYASWQQPGAQVVSPAR